MIGGVCIGGLRLDNTAGVRLLTRYSSKQPVDTPFDIGHIWDLRFRSAGVRPPHIEDVTVFSEKYIGVQPDLRDFLLHRVCPWHGGPDQLYNGLLCADGKSGYICASRGLPRCSTGFWLPDKPLHLTRIFNDKLYYSYEGTLNIRYVGCMDPLEQIPAHSLLRVSLSRWWAPEGVREDRCYLQLSGWYAHAPPSRVGIRQAESLRGRGSACSPAD